MVMDWLPFKPPSQLLDCVSYFSHCCDQIVDKKQRKEKVFILTQGLRDTVYHDEKGMVAVGSRHRPTLGMSGSKARL